MGISVRAVQPLPRLSAEGEEEHVVRVTEVGSSQYPRRKLEGSLYEPGLERCDWK